MRRRVSAEYTLKLSLKEKTILSARRCWGRNSWSPTISASPRANAKSGSFIIQTIPEKRAALESYLVVPQQLVLVHVPVVGQGGALADTAGGHGHEGLRVGAGGGAARAESGAARIGSAHGSEVRHE